MMNRNTRYTNLEAVAFLLLIITTLVTSFTPLSSTTTHLQVISPSNTLYTTLHMTNDSKGGESGGGGNGDDFDMMKGGETYEGDIDWDAEWKKVVAEKGTSTAPRPGSDFYKTDVEKAVSKTTRAVQERIPEVKVEIPSVRSLQGDTKFWFGILALISVGTALISASSQSVYTNDSFYI